MNIIRETISVGVGQKIEEAQLQMAFIKNKVNLELFVQQDGQIITIEKWEGTVQEFHDKVLQPFWEDLMVERDQEEERQRFRNFGMDEEQVEAALRLQEEGGFEDEEIMTIMDFEPKVNPFKKGSQILIDLYREAGMSEEWIQNIVPESQDEVF
jgi:hypothetical protein